MSNSKSYSLSIADPIIRLTDDQRTAAQCDFDDFVYRHNAAEHSGVLCAVLDMRPGTLTANKMDVLERLAQFASYSITAYSALEWWHQFQETYPPFVEKLNGIMARIEKPKTYVQLESTLKTVED